MEILIDLLLCFAGGTLLILNMALLMLISL